MKLFKTKAGVAAFHNGQAYRLTEEWDALINQDNLFRILNQKVGAIKPEEAQSPLLTEDQLLAPIGLQEVWAAGVTYFRSREARMEESKTSGAANFYDKVYDAERPELFFKATPQRVAGPGEKVHIRRDSSWNVPEPELTLFINSRGSIQGYTIGNDMSSRSIEGENPLYLPQAKTYDRSAALGPCLYVPEVPMPSDTKISMTITRNGKPCYEDQVAISQMKRKHTELAGYLYRECNFPYGCFLMTGTCLVPGNDFTLAKGDVVSISIDHIGTLVNEVSLREPH